MASLTKIKIGPWIASPAQNLLENGERSIKIEPRAMDLLTYLAAHPGDVVSVDELLAAVWPGVVVGDGSVYVAIKQLRRALTVPGDGTDYIETIPKRGYRLTVPVELLAPQPPASGVVTVQSSDGNAHFSSSDASEPRLELLPSALPGVAGPNDVSLWRVAHPPAPVARSATDDGGTRRWRRPTLLAGVLVVGLAVAIWVAAPYLRPEPTLVIPQVRAEIPVAGDYTMGLAISPNGQYIAYGAGVDGVRAIWLRPSDGFEARALPGTENAFAFFWSPDSRYLAFTANGKLQKIDIAGGHPQAVADAPRASAPDGTWGAGSTILYLTRSGEIGHVPASGGTVTPIAGLRATKDPACEVPRYLRTLARTLPDGEQFLYFDVDCGSSKTYELYVGSLTGAAPVHVKTISLMPRADPAPVLRTGSFNVAYANGFLLWLLDGNLVAQPFDVDALSVHGEATTLAEDVGEFSVSATGLLIYRHSRILAGQPAPTRTRRLVWFDRSGNRMGEVRSPGPYTLPRLSADGRHLALTVLSNSVRGLHTADVWRVDTETSEPRRLTSDEAMDAGAIWSPDGGHIAFSSGRSATLNQPSRIYRRAANGSGSDRLLFSPPVEEFAHPWDWSHDGRYVLFGHRRLQTYRGTNDIWVLPISGGPAQALLESPYRKGHVRFSPDDRWIAYSTNETGGDHDEIVVRPFPNVNDGWWQVSSRGGIEPTWRNDGRELVYLDPDGVLMSVSVHDTEIFGYEPPQALFRTGLRMSEWKSASYYYDMAGDGGRFLINEPIPDAPQELVAWPAQPAAPIKVIVNWNAGLAR